MNKLNFDIGAGNSFGYTGAVSNFASTDVVSGRTNLSGSIAGAVTVDAGAQLSAGASGVGALTVGDTTFGTGSDFAVDLDPANGQNDVLNVNGTVSPERSTTSSSIFCPRRKLARLSTS